MSTRERLLLLGAIVAHRRGAAPGDFPGSEMRFGFGVAVSLDGLAGGFYWSRPYTRLDGLHAAVMPAGAIGSLVPMLFPGDHVANATSPAFRAHFPSAMLAYSLFHPGRPARDADVGSRAPAPQRTLQPPALRPAAPAHHGGVVVPADFIAFVLLTLTLASGVLFSESLFGQAFRSTTRRCCLRLLVPLRRPAGGPPPVRLARPAGAALDPGRFASR